MSEIYTQAGIMLLDWLIVSCIFALIAVITAEIINAKKENKQ